MDLNPSVRSRFRLWFCILALACVQDASAAYPREEMTSVMTEDEKKIQNLRSQEIEQLRIALGRRLPDRRKADLYVRLAETYIEAYRSEFLIEGKVHEKRLADGKTDKFIDRAQSKPYLSLGIRACEEVIRLGIAHSKLDQIYYFLGVNYDELENEKSAIQYFRLLIQKFPTSPYAGEAHRALAESAYGKNNFKEALSHYQIAIRNYQGTSMPRLLQKMAWTQYRLRQYDRAVSTMKEAISKASEDNRFLNLKDEALRDMALFMTESGKVEEALAYFKSVGGDKDFYPATLERLGAQYERSAEPKKAIQVYESLLKTNPTDDASFRVRVKLFEIDLKRRQFASALKRVSGVPIPRGGDEDTKTSARNLRAQIRKTAVDEHDDFRKSQDKSSLAVAENYYTFYLNQFLAKDDDRKETPEVQMYLAEVKREMGKSQDAAVLYRQVIRSKDDRYAKQAAAFWMASLGESIKKLKATGNTEELAKYQKDYIEASDYVADAFGDKPEGLQAKLNLAQVLAGSKDTQSTAEDRIKDLIKDAPKSSQAHTAAKLWVQLYADQLPKKPEELQKSSQAKDLMEVIEKIRKNSDLMDYDSKTGKKELAGQMESLETKIKIGVIASQEKSKDYASAARGYEEFAKNESKQDVAEKAYVSAVGSYVKAMDYDSVIRVSSDWLKRFKGSKEPLEQIRLAATHAIIMGQFSKAAELFRILGRRGDSSALEVAGRLYEGTGNLTEASSDFKFYLDGYKESKDRGQIALSLAQWYDYSKNEALAVKYYKLCFSEKNETSAECGSRLSDLYAKLENNEQADSMLRQVAQMGKGKQGDPSPWVGYARYRIAERLERDKKFNPLSLPDDRLKRGLEERVKFLDQLNKSYQTVVEASGPWAVAALDRLANWVVGFADDVDSIKPPVGSSPQAVEGFKKSLKTVSDPLRVKAYDTWKTAYQKAVAGELLSPSLPLIADRLADQGISPPARAQGFRDKFRLTGQPADGGKEGRMVAFERVRAVLLEDAKNVAAWIDYGNLLWGEGKPLLARQAYERALSLNSKAAAALNNRGVLIVSGSGQEDWIRVAEANQFFKSAIDKDELFLAAKFNRGAVLNYYRIFSKARPYWTQVAAVAAQADVLDGLAISEQGIGDYEQASKTFQRASKAGGASKRTSFVYHEAGRYMPKDASKCVSTVSRIDDDEVFGFERQAAAHLKATCTQWKAEKRK